jgi:hypothetical protein
VPVCDGKARHNNSTKQHPALGKLKLETADWQSALQVHDSVAILATFLSLLLVHTLWCALACYLLPMLCNPYLV